MPWLALGYPALAHLGVWWQNPYLQWLALTWLIAMSLWGALKARRAWAWCTLIGGAGVLYLITLRGNGIYALYIPPILIPGALLMLFARSLRRGEVPLITRFAETLRGETLPEILRRYTRTVTWLWVVVSALLLLSAVATALWSSEQVWSLTTNVIHYVVLGAVFALEFAYRRVRYARYESWGLVQYLKRLARTRLA